MPFYNDQQKSFACFIPFYFLPFFFNMPAKKPLLERRGVTNNHIAKTVYQQLLFYQVLLKISLEQGPP